jgi:hypothetical protein
MERSGLIDLHREAETWRAEGWEGYPATGATMRSGERQWS